MQQQPGGKHARTVITGRLVPRVGLLINIAFEIAC